MDSVRGWTAPLKMPKHIKERLFTAIKGNSSLEYTQSSIDFWSNDSVVDLEGHDVGDPGAMALAATLTYNTRVSVLNLPSNGIGNEGAIGIANAIRYNTVLQKLLLQSNNISNSGVVALASALEQNVSIQKLRLDGNCIGFDGACAISHSLRINKTLTYLSLADNCIGRDGASKLVSALRVNTSLEVLHLCKNWIGTDGAKDIAFALRHNSTLKEIGLAANGIEDDGAHALAQAFGTTNSIRLQKVLLGLNNFTTQGGILTILKEATKKNIVVDFTGGTGNDAHFFASISNEQLNELQKENNGKDDTNGISNSTTFSTKREEGESTKIKSKFARLVANAIIDRQMNKKTAFYEKLMEKDHRNIIFKIDSLCSLIRDVNQMKFYYTTVQTAVRLGLLGDEDRNRYILQALQKTAGLCTCKAALVMFKVILDKAESDDLIDSAQKYDLENDALVTQLENTEFIQTMKASIDANTNLIQSIGSTMEGYASQVESLESNVEVIASSVARLKCGLDQKFRIDACVSFVSAVLNALSFGFGGTLITGAMSTTLSLIVDFGDISHIEKIASESENAEVKKKAMEAGMKIGVSSEATTTTTTMKDSVMDKVPNEADILSVILSIAIILHSKTSNVHPSTPLGPSSSSSMKQKQQQQQQQRRAQAIAHRIQQLEEALGIDCGSKKESSIRKRLELLEQECFGSFRDNCGTMVDRIVYLERHLLQSKRSL